MIKITDVKWDDFKRIILMVQNDMSECDGFDDLDILDNGRTLSNVADTFNHDHVFARVVQCDDPKMNYIEWYIDDVDTLIMWHVFMDDLKNDGLFNNDVVQTICDNIDSYLKKLGVDINGQTD